MIHNRPHQLLSAVLGATAILAAGLGLVACAGGTTTADEPAPRVTTAIPATTEATATIGGPTTEASTTTEAPTTTVATTEPGHDPFTITEMAAWPELFLSMRCTNGYTAIASTYTPPLDEATFNQQCIGVELTPPSPFLPPNTVLPSSPEGQITMAEFEAIQSGMSMAEVADIVGGPGEIVSVSDIARIHTETRMWDGPILGASANVIFQTGAVISKAQFGL